MTISVLGDCVVVEICRGNCGNDSGVLHQRKHRTPSHGNNAFHRVAAHIHVAHLAGNASWIAGSCPRTQFARGHHREAESLWVGRRLR